MSAEEEPVALEPHSQDPLDPHSPQETNVPSSPPEPAAQAQPQDGNGAGNTTVDPLPPYPESDPAPEPVPTQELAQEPVPPTKANTVTVAYTKPRDDGRPPRGVSGRRPAYEDDPLETKFKCFVGGLPHDYTNSELKDIFDAFIPTKAMIMVEKHSRKSRGFGFVWFPNADARDAAIAKLHNTRLFDRHISVSKAIPKEEVPPGDQKYGPVRRSGGIGGGCGGGGGRRGEPYHPRERGGFSGGGGGGGGAGARRMYVPGRGYVGDDRYSPPPPHFDHGRGHHRDDDYPYEYPRPPYDPRFAPDRSGPPRPRPPPQYAAPPYGGGPNYPPPSYGPPPPYNVYGGGGGDGPGYGGSPPPKQPYGGQQYPEQPGGPPPPPQFQHQYNPGPPPPQQQYRQYSPPRYGNQPSEYRPPY